MVRFDQPCRTRYGALNYFSEHMSKGDYLTEDGQSEMIWFGQGAERLGLSGQVNAEHFARLCDGLHPETGKRLTIRNNGSHRRVCFFGQISAPKDVSIALLVGGDKRLEQWWNESVQETLQEIELATLTRVRRFWRNEDRVTGNMIASVVTHDASRSLDPQLHTHVCIMNLTYDAVEHRWKSVQPSGFFAHQGYFREVCYNKLAQRMMEAGYELERERKIGFTIKGFPTLIREQFSKRREAILKKAEQAGVSGQDALQKITASTRASKKNVSAEELCSRWLSECGASLNKIQQVIREADGHSKATIRLPAVEALRIAEQHLFERSSVVKERALLREALIAGRGQVSLNSLKNALQNRVETKELIRQGEQITSRETLIMETEFIQWARSGKRKCSRFGDETSIESYLNEEQRLAVKHILRCKDRVVVLQGDAGTGKTVSLKEVVKGIEQAGGSVFACAPTSGATDVLRKELTPHADTLQQLLVNPQLQREVRGKTIVVDEAGLISVRQMRDLCRLANQHQNRLILVGDIKQHASVEAGDALRALQEYAEVQSVRLTQIQRQKNRGYRQAVALLAQRKPLQAFEKFEKLNAVREVKDEHLLLDRVAEDYLSALKQGQSCLVISPVWSEIHRFTEHARKKLKVSGLLKEEERSVLTSHSFQWTKAEREDARNYQAGDVLTFHRNTTVFAKGETVRLIERREHRIVVEKDNGERFIFDPRRITGFDVGLFREIPLSIGEKLLMRGNIKSQKIQNGDVVEVMAFKDDGSVQLKDGRALPARFRQFTYGYATTSHAAQGKTVDRGILLLSEEGIRAGNFKQAYVSNSRFRESQAIYTTNLPEAKDAMATNTERMLALEMAQKQSLRARFHETLLQAAEVWQVCRRKVAAAMQSVGLKQKGISYGA